jgi:hypothetical protein
MKEMVSKLKRLFTEREKIFGRYTSEMILITRKPREFRKLPGSAWKSAEWGGEGEGRIRGGEMTQTMYVHVNK